MNSDDIVSKMVDRIVGRFRPERVLLFGSRARGDAAEWSDVDLLVVMPEGTDRRQAAVDMHLLLGDMPLPKDIVVTTPAEIARRGQIVGTVLRSALRQGKVMYG